MINERQIPAETVVDQREEFSYKLLSIVNENENNQATSQASRTLEEEQTSKVAVKDTFAQTSVPAVRKCANTPIVEYDKHDPYSFIDFAQRSHSTSEAEYLMITRKTNEVLNKDKEIWHYLYLIKSRDNKNSQMLTTLMKSNTDEYRKLLLLYDALK